MVRLNENQYLCQIVEVNDLDGSNSSGHDKIGKYIVLDGSKLVIENTLHLIYVNSINWELTDKVLVTSRLLRYDIDDRNKAIRLVTRKTEYILQIIC